MLDPEIFKEKYPETVYKQIHPESFIETISEEERELFSNAEILTGKSLQGKFNRFNNYAVANPGKPRNSFQIRLTNLFKKFLDKSIDSGELEDVFQKLLTSSKKGDFRCIQYLLDRALGKEAEKIDIKVGKIDVELNIPDKFKKKEE